MKNTLIFVVIIILFIGMSCKKENKPEQEKSPVTRLNGVWDVDSTVISSYEDNEETMRAVLVTNPYSLDFSLTDKIISRKISQSDTADFIYITSYNVLTNYFQTDTSQVLDTVYIISIQKDERAALLSKEVETYNNINYITHTEVFITKQD